MVKFTYATNEEEALFHNANRLSLLVRDRQLLRAVSFSDFFSMKPRPDYVKNEELSNIKSGSMDQKKAFRNEI